MNLPPDIQLLKSTGDIGILPISPSDLESLSLPLAVQILEGLTADQRANTAILLATTHACLRTDLDFDRSRREANGRYASPAAFRATLPSALMAELSVQLGIKGPMATILPAKGTPQEFAIRRAIAWLRHMPIEHCLTGFFDWPWDKPPEATFHLLHRPSTTP